MSVKKRILITGGAGFLGSHLCDRFIQEGYHVIAMDNLITGDVKNIEHLFHLAEFEFYHHDVSKFVFVPGELDYILHFASPASPIDFFKIPLQTLKFVHLELTIFSDLHARRNPEFWLHQLQKFMVILQFIRKQKNIGAM